MPLVLLELMDNKVFKVFKEQPELKAHKAYKGKLGNKVLKEILV